MQPGHRTGGRAPASLPILPWRRNLAALTAASFIGFTGFTLVMPFLPLYIAELGVRDIGSIALWTGFTLGVTPALTALLAPAWGRLADRFGRKLMVARSLASFVVIMAAMAWVTSPWQLFALRAIQGLFAGYGALCLAMAADSSPRERVAQSIGMVQTAQRLGPALGPVLGGSVAALVGLRTAFLVTSVFYIVALVQLLVLYKEPSLHHASGAGAPARVTFANVLAFENFLLLMVAIFGLQFVDRSFGPVLPLHVAALGVPPSRVAFVSGAVFSALACSAAVGHHFCARLLRRWSARDVISTAAIVSAVAVALFVVIGSAWALVVAAAVFGGGIGAAMTAAYAAAAGVVPANARGAAFGFLSSASLAGLALSPVACGFLAATDIRIVFAADALALCVLAALVRRVMIEHPRVTDTPVVADA
jgi:MFS transporter, DHA1 family, multidrug resistance protein